MPFVIRRCYLRPFSKLACDCHFVKTLRFILASEAANTGREGEEPEDLSVVELGFTR